MELITDKVSISKLQEMAGKMFGNLVKAVVDVRKKILVVDGELHADEYVFLLEKGSNQADLWGVNIYPHKTGGEMVEFDSVINIRPHQDNKSKGVESSEVRKKISEIINKLVVV